MFEALVKLFLIWLSVLSVFMGARVGDLCDLCTFCYLAVVCDFRSVVLNGLQPTIASERHTAQTTACLSVSVVAVAVAVGMSVWPCLFDSILLFRLSAFCWRDKMDDMMAEIERVRENDPTTLS